MYVLVVLNVYPSTHALIKEKQRMNQPSKEGIDWKERWGGGGLAMDTKHSTKHEEVVAVINENYDLMISV